MRTLHTVESRSGGSNYEDGQSQIRQTVDCTCGCRSRIVESPSDHGLEQRVELTLASAAFPEQYDCD